MLFIKNGIIKVEATRESVLCAETSMLLGKVYGILQANKPKMADDLFASIGRIAVAINSDEPDKQVEEAFADLIIERLEGNDK